MSDYKEALKSFERSKNAIYLERNRVVAALARAAITLGWKAGKTIDNTGNVVVIIELPTGQASWHFIEEQCFLLDGLPTIDTHWDGHTTEEKYDNIEQFVMQMWQPNKNS